MSTWKYYNHALIPSVSPHSVPNLNELKHSWSKIDKRYSLLARWTEDFDIETETEWWYCICDKPFDIKDLKAKRRNVITNARKYCSVSVCNPIDYFDSLYTIYQECQYSYYSKKKIKLNKGEFISNLKKLKEQGNYVFYICFFKETSECVGYSIVKKNHDFAYLVSQKASPSFEKYQVNAAIVDAILNDFKDELNRGYYICDGMRNINHDTHFQEYLEKYFGFRKAYCYLKIKYRLWVKIIIGLLYPFKNVFRKIKSSKVVHLINSLLLMEEISRRQKWKD